MSMYYSDEFMSLYNVSADTSSTSHRKTLKACDPCRKRKIRCNGQEVQGSRCLQCQASSNANCTYTMPAIVNKRGSKAYVEDLEIRIANTEKLINQAFPGINISKALKEIDEPPPDSRIYLHSITLTTPSLLSETQQADLLSHDSDKLDPSDDEYQDPGEEDEFMGKSSNSGFVRFVRNKRSVATGIQEKASKGRVHFRNEVWGIQPWMKTQDVGSIQHVEFPDPDYLAVLVQLYFTHSNVFLPVLHRPIFERALADELHHRDSQFGMIVLLVCSIGARFSDDCRVTRSVFRDYKEDDPRSFGWVWFYEAQRMRRSLLCKPSLYDVQGYCLSAIFLEGCPAHTKWTLIGTGIRSCQELGVHRKRKYGHPSAHDELWKRVFWCLFVLDRCISGALGRICGLQDEDFDLDLPIECDDEYWDTEYPEHAFKQPPGKPSYMSYFIWLVKNSQILGIAFRKLYSIKPTNALDSVCDVARLEESMKAWSDSLPAHLRWDPNRHDCGSLFYEQSVVLHATFYLNKFVVHRPFIDQLAVGNHSLAAAEMKICVESANACLELVDVAKDQMSVATLRMCIKPLFTTALAFMLHMWSGRKDVDNTKEMESIHRCMDILGILESAWSAPGKVRSTLYKMIHGNDNTPVFDDKRQQQPDGKEHLTSTKMERKTPLVIDGRQFVCVNGEFVEINLKKADLSRQKVPSLPTSAVPPCTLPDTITPFEVNYSGSMAGTNGIDDGQAVYNVAEPASMLVGGDGDLQTSLPPIMGMDNGKFGSWSGAPSTNEWDEWSLYFGSMSELVCTMQSGRDQVAEDLHY